MIAPLSHIATRTVDGGTSLPFVKTLVLPNGSLAAGATPTEAVLTIDVSGAIAAAMAAHVAAADPHVQYLTEARGDARYAAVGSGVLSFNARTGAVTAQAGDYTAAQVTGAARLDAANTFAVGENVFRPGGAGVVPIVAQGHAGQTANLQEWQSSTGGVYAYVTTDNAGGFDGGVFRIQRQAYTANNITMVASQTTGLFMAYGTGDTTALVKDSGPNIFGSVLYATQGGRGTTGLFFAVQAGGMVQELTNSILPSSASAVQDAVINLGLPAARFAGFYSARGQFLNDTAASVVLTVKGATAQAVNLQEWQSSTGTVLTAVAATGYAGIATTPVVGIPLVVRRSLGADASVYTNTELIALFQSRDSGPGSARVAIDVPSGKNGVLAFYENAVHRWEMRVDAGGSVAQLGAVVTTPDSATVIPLTVKGATAQSANLQEWQDSTGAVLTNVSAVGAVVARVPAVPVTNTDYSCIRAYNAAETAWVGLGAIGTPYLTASTTLGFSVNGNASTHANLSTSGFVLSPGLYLGWNSGELGFLRVDANTIQTFGASSTGTLGAILCGAPTAGTVGLTVKGATSQTANLQEWQDSTGTVRAKITKGGIGVFGDSGNGSLSAGVGVNRANDGSAFPLGLLDGTNAFHGVLVHTSNNTNVFVGNGIIAQIGAGNDTGSAYGQLYIDAIPLLINRYSGGSVGINVTAASAQLHVKSGAAGTIGQIVQGATAQTANLQEWQDSTGTVLAAVDKDGSFISSPAGSAYGFIGKSGTWESTADANFAVGSRTTTLNLYGGNSVTPTVTVTGSQAFIRSLIVNPGGTNYGFLGKSGDWISGESASDANFMFASYRPSFYLSTNNQTTVYLSVNPNGLVGINTGLATPVAQLEVDAYTAAAKGLVVKGATAQSANLQEWQDSTGTALAYVASTGYLNLSRIDGIGSVTISAQTPGDGNINLTARVGNFVSVTNGDLRMNAGTISHVAAVTANSGTNLALETTAAMSLSASWQVTVSAPLVGINKASSIGGQLHVQTGDAARVAIVAQGATSQTANIVDCFDSTSANYFSVTPACAAHVRATTSGYAPALWVSDSNSTLGGALYFEWRAGASGNKVHAFVADAYGLGFYRMADGGSSFIRGGPVPDLVIDPTGRVGLGLTTTVSGTLHVKSYASTAGEPVVHAQAYTGHTGPVTTVTTEVAGADDPTVSTYQNQKTTTDDTVTTLHTLTLADETAYLISATVLARRTGGAAGSAGDSAAYVVRAKAKRTGGGGATIGAVDAPWTDEDQAGWDCTLDASGNDVRVRVKGASSNNVTWHLVKFEVSPLSS